MNEGEHIWFNRMILILLVILWTIPFIFMTNLFLNIIPRWFILTFIVISFSLVIICIIMFVKESNGVRPIRWINITDSLIRNTYTKFAISNITIMLGVFSLFLIFVLFSSAETPEQYKTANLYSLTIIGISILLGLYAYGFTFKIIPKYFHSETKYFEIDVSRAYRLLKKNLVNLGSELETKHYPKKTLMPEYYQLRSKDHDVNIILQSPDNGTRISVNYRASEKATKEELKKSIDRVLS